MNPDIAVIVRDIVQELSPHIARNADVFVVTDVVAADHTVAARFYSIVGIIGAVVPGDDRCSAGLDPLDTATNGVATDQIVVSRRGHAEGTARDNIIHY